MGRRKKRIINKINVTLNSPNEKKSSKWEKVKGWIAVIASVITIMTFGFIIYDRFYKEDKVETLKKEILATIDDIEKDLNSNAIINSPDSSFIREYQQEVASICAQWRSLEGNNLFSDMKAQKDEDLLLMAANYLIRKDKYNQTLSNVFDLLEQYHAQHKGINYDYAKILKLQDGQKAKITVTQKAFEVIKERANKGDSKGILEGLDKLRKDQTYYLIDKDFFNFVREINKTINATLVSQ